MPVPIVVVAIVKAWLKKYGVKWTVRAIIAVFGYKVFEGVLEWLVEDDPAMAAELRKAAEEAQTTDDIPTQEHVVHDLEAHGDVLPAIGEIAAAAPAAALPAYCPEIVLDPYTEALIEDRQIDRLLRGGGPCDR